MTTPTPTPEAVEAAIAWIHADYISAHQLALINDYPVKKMGASWNAARILAAEVERLRARVAELEGEQVPSKEDVG